MLSFLKPRTAEPIAGRIYTEVEIGAAREALKKFQKGEDKDAEKLLKKHRIGSGDMEPAVAQFWAAFGLGNEDDSEDEPSRDVHEDTAVSVVPEPQAFERATVNVDLTYKDSIEQREKLIAALCRKLGDGWQVESFKAEGAFGPSVVIVRGDLPSTRPGEATYGFSEKATVVDIVNHHAKDGRTVLGIDLGERQVVAAELPPATMELRGMLLRRDGKQKSWDLEILPVFAVTDGVGHLDRVIISRADQHFSDHAREVDYWLGVARNVVGHAGWRVTVNAKTGEVVLIHGVRPELPRLVPGSAVLPKMIDTKDWSNFVVGLNSKSEEVSINLEAGPHSLVVGGTGAGKSVALRAIILNALARGFEIIIIDPTKQAAGLRGIEPWTKGIFIKDLEEAAAALNAVYKEVRRRVDMISEVRGENWRDLPDGSVRPILVIVDEFSALVTPDKKPMGIQNDHPVMVEWMADASARAQIQSKVGRIAKEARSAGVHLVLSTQRPDASDIGGNVRDNLGTILQMIAPARPPSPDALRMVFPADYVSKATEEIDLLNDGRSRGFALSYIEGGGLQAVRIGFVDKDDMEEYAERLGIPFGDPLEIAESEPRGFEVVESEWTPPEEPKVVFLEEMELGLDDLVWDDEQTDTAEAPEVPTEPQDDDDPFAAEPTVRTPAVPDDDDPFGAPVKPKANPKVDDFEW